MSSKETSSKVKKTPINKYDYIELLVIKIKTLYDAGQEYDMYFEELLALFFPLITNISRKLYNKCKGEISSQEIKSRVIGLIFLAIIRYNPKYKMGENKKKFTYVYFSSYLKKFIPWEVMRILKPPRIDYDDLHPDPRNVELNLNHPVKEVSKRLIYNSSTEHPISENFISLCKLARKDLKSDILGDIMILVYGYGFKNREVSEMLNINEHRIGALLSELKKFWKANAELLRE